MASHALSKRRGYKPRPDVCATHRNPGRCEPPVEPPTVTCHLGIAHFNLEEDEEQGQDLTACKTDLPVDEPVSVSFESDILSVEQTSDVFNCHEEEEPGEYVVTADQGPGEGFVTATFTFSDDTTCQDTATVTVEEEE